MPVRRIDALMGLMKAMKEEGHPQGLPGLHERVIGKVVLWGDGLGWACGEPHEAELGEDWDPPPPGGDCRRRLDGDSVNMRGGVASRCLWGCDISTVMWGHGTCCRWRSSPPMGQSEERTLRGLGLWAGETGLAVYVASSQSQGHW